VAKRSARDTKVKTMNQIRHLGFTAPDELREHLAGVPRKDLAAIAAALRPRDGGDQVAFATKTALCLLGRRVVALEAEKELLDELLAKFVEKTAPQLLALYGVGVDTAAALLAAAGDNPERTRSEARLGAPVRGGPHRGVVGQGDALEVGPRRGPPGQRRPVRHRDNPYGR
jgi:transposase